MNPTKPQNPLILSHSSILLPASTKIPMASFGNSRLCRCYTLMTFTPLYPIYPTQFDIRQTGFDKISLLLCGIRYKMISRNFSFLLTYFPQKRIIISEMGNHRQESSCQTVENFIFRRVPARQWKTLLIRRFPARQWETLKSKGDRYDRPFLCRRYQ